MKNDLKIGTLIGMVLAVGIVLMISLWPGQSVDQRHRDTFAEDEVDLPITTKDQQTPTKHRPPDLPENPIPTQTEKTPINKTPPQRIHTVKKGETLSSISLQYYGTTRHTKRILEANKNRLANKNQIRHGMWLIIPKTE